MKKNAEIMAKSSRRFVLLLLIFLHLPVFAYDMKPDTLILDGEVVYINKVEVAVNIDSLEKEGYKDLTSPHIYKKKYLSLLAGADLLRVQQNTGEDSMSTLSAFLGKGKDYFVQPMASLQGILMFTNQIGIYSGVGISRIKARFIEMDASTLANDSVRFRFENREGQLWQYYFYPVGIGYETDTIRVPTNTQTIAFYALDIPLGARFFLSNPERKKSTSVFMDLGMNLRWAINGAGATTGNSALLNEKGAYKMISNTELSPRSFYALAQLRGGVMFSLSKSWWLQSYLQLNFPPYSINRGEHCDLRLSNYTLCFGISHLFDGK
ncbi:MAG: hypothetical protein IT223_07060 [Crocinitomicaceae bacterium]|nr:hypothetical protein [Crocinitomicaceae bacterium]